MVDKSMHQIQRKRELTQIVDRSRREYPSQERRVAHASNELDGAERSPEAPRYDHFWIDGQAERHVEGLRITPVLWRRE